MKSPLFLARRVHFLHIALLLLFVAVPPAPGFFFLINGFLVMVGQSISVTVKGSSPSATVNLQSIFSSGSGQVALGEALPKSGKGSVSVILIGVTAGSGSVGFSGTNNGGSVFGSLNVNVIPGPGTVAQNPFVGIGGDPVSTKTGEYFGNEGTDLDLGGPMPLAFSRYVASKLASDGFVQANLGSNRSHNFASRMITVTPVIKQVVLPSGAVLKFDKSGTKWVLSHPLDTPYQLVETAGNFLLGNPETKHIWTYDNTGKLTKIEDGKGNEHTLTYTGGKLSSVTDGIGRTITINQPGTEITSITDHTASRTVNYNYSGGVLVSVQDYGGHTTTYTANGGGLPVSHMLPVGNVPFTQSYTGAKVTTQTERGTDISTLLYNPATTTFTDPLNKTLVDGYDLLGRLITHTDQGGKTISMTYDSAGRRSSVTDRLGNKTSIVYHAGSGGPQTITNTEGKVTSYTYKPRTVAGIVFNDVTKITYPDGASRSFTYDAKGNITQITDEAGKVWKYTYNGKGQVLTATNPLGGVMTSTYDPAGNLLTVQPPEMGTTSYIYDLRHRITQITRPGGAQVTLAYDGKDRLISQTDERTKVWQYTYDNNNNLTVVTDPDTETTTNSYDVLDRMTATTDRLSQPTSMTFDSRRLLSSLTNPNGGVINLTYDDRRRMTGLEDAGGQDWLFTYDNEGRLVTTQTPVDPPDVRKLNKLGFVTQSVDPLGNTRNLTRDAMQRVTSSIDPLGRVTNFAFDKRGCLVSATEQGTGTAKYDRDGLGHVTKLTDPNGGVWSMVYQKAGRLTKVTDPLGKATTITYDSRGRPLTSTFADAHTCTMGYDAASNPTSSVFSAGPNLLFTYDNLNRLTSANGVAFEYDAEGRLSNCEQNTHDFTATYDNGGRLLTVSYLDGAFTVTYGYDSRNRLTSVTDSEGTSIVMGYDNAGRLTSQTRTPGIDSSYVYDAAGRLTQILEGGAATLNYGLNPASEVVDLDITAPTLPGVAASTKTFKHGKAGEITTTDYAYDVRGRLTASPGKTYQWDGASQLVDISGVTLAYNGVGDIVTRTETAQTTRFYHHYALNLSPIVYEDLPSGSDRMYVWTPGGRLLYSVDVGSGDPTFYHFDRVGSTLALSDSAGSVTDSYAYGPYGELLAHTGGSTQPFTYVGGYGVRTEGALYHMRSRYYDPTAAQFLSRDPLPPRLADPKSTHTYSYASQNPLRYIDPEGGLVCAPFVEGLGVSSQRRPALNFLKVATPMDDSPKPIDRIFVSYNYFGGNGCFGGAPPSPDRLPFCPPFEPPFMPLGSNVFGDPTTGDCGFDLFILRHIAFPDIPFGDPPLVLEVNDDILASDFPPKLPPGYHPLYGNTVFNASGNPGGLLLHDNEPPLTNNTINCDGPGDTPAQDQAQQADGGGGGINQAAMIEVYKMIYRAYKMAEDALAIKAQNNGLQLTPEETRAAENFKKLRKAMGKIIKKMGGTLPDTDPSSSSL